MIIKFTGKQLSNDDMKELMSSEDTYRRGYYHGYSAAMDEFLQLHNRGFVRAREIWNILARFYDTKLRRWRYGVFHTQQVEMPPNCKCEEWASIRIRILRRDRCCVRCGDVLRLEVDHIQEVQNGGLPTDDNLRVLCKACHSTKAQWDR